MCTCREAQLGFDICCGAHGVHRRLSEDAQSSGEDPFVTPMFRLKCPAQNYAWGRRPSSSLEKQGSEVAALTQASGVPVDEDKPYAELWMGTHPSGPAVLTADPETTLQAWLEQHPEALGTEVMQRFGVTLPFLFKVLSVETALSIQSHPDKRLAERLHAERPKVYKDANHKPEMAVALDGFEALCSFVPHGELVAALEAVPELRACVGEARAAACTRAGRGDSASDAQARREALRGAFTALMTCEPGVVATQLDALIARLAREEAEGSSQSPGNPRDRLVQRLAAQYPGDVGALAAYFLNHVALQPGEAIYLAANEPHAYLAGELVECMATSDNVIRAGLTPKLRDTAVLCASLTYGQGPPEVLRGSGLQAHLAVYAPPFDEFEVQRLELPAGAATPLPANPGPMLALVQEGGGRARAVPSFDAPVFEDTPTLARGDVFFVPAHTPLQVEASQEGLRVWLAAVNSRLFDARFRLPASAGQQPAAHANGVSSMPSPRLAAAAA